MTVKPPSEQIDLAQASLNFALPYGGIGIATDVITFYISVMLLCSKSPLFWSNCCRNTLEDGTSLKHARFNAILAVMQFSSTIIIPPIVIVESQNCHLQFITSLKLVTSLISSAIAFSAGRQESQKRSERSEPTLIPVWILAIFIAATIGIMFGAITLASNLVRHGLKFGVTTGIYGITTTTVILLIMTASALHHWYRWHPEGDEDAHETYSELEGDAEPSRSTQNLGYECYRMLSRVLNFRSAESGCIIWGICATSTQVYIDLIVGLAAENIGGNPNPKAGLMTWLFWLYFGFQVLPLLSC
ncbi:uncharacterized protein Bfra_003154 [Botrytis fragariae]|uniref:Uncharacterized protein n=1 Tax=Botrytis fragariae TaxID=1964551 RepID=A0A8H6B050_9HELO|nr:uncharacterized protein Bfra_003154 [Botrytis fragariae]KAF5876748.1 hypothetical protein Bfra_003154 [Botrytis fragariae]